MRNIGGIYASQETMEQAYVIGQGYPHKPLHKYQVVHYLYTLARHGCII